MQCSESVVDVFGCIVEKRTADTPLLWRFFIWSDPIYINRSRFGSGGVAVSLSSALPSPCSVQRTLRLANMRTVRYWYSAKCPATGCSESAWKKAGKCRATSLEHAQAKLQHHLNKSSLHYMPKLGAEQMAQDHHWDVHDTDEEDVGGGTADAAPSEARSRRSRSPARTRSPVPIGSRRTHQRNVLAIGPPGGQSSSRSDDDRRQQMEYCRVISAVESSIRAARRAERLSRSAAVAFAAEAIQLETALEALQRIA